MKYQIIIEIYIGFSEYLVDYLLQETII